MSDWPVKPITEIVDFNPPRKIKKGTIAPFIEMASLPTGAREVSEVGEREFKGSGSKFQNGDTLFARITPCLENGKTAKVTVLNESDVAHGSTEFIVMSAKDKQYDENFVYYIARMPEFRNYAQSRMEGTSGRQRVPWQALATYELPIPPKEVRKQISDILSSIDNKIELNRQINQCLEHIAQAIFKSWFVDFEPVKTKIQAKQMGQDPERAAMCAISGKTDAELDHLKTLPSPSGRGAGGEGKPRSAYDALAATAALFPNELEDSELGEIPKGWGVREIREWGNVVCGKTPPKKELSNYGGHIPFIKIPDMHGNVFAILTSDTLSVKGAETQKRKEITKGSVCVSCIATVGQVVIASEECHTNQQINSIVPANKEHSSYLYFCMLGKKKALHDLASGGSATLNLNTGSFSKVPLICPGDKSLSAFSRVVESMFESILENDRQSKVLSEIRDTLLPKLLSGEIVIKNTQSTEETAA